MPGNRQAFSTAMNTADRYRWDSHWGEAMQEYQRALAEFPDDATARSGLGFCYMQTKQWQQALNEYEYTLKREPGNVIALSKTAELYGILTGVMMHIKRIFTWPICIHRLGKVHVPKQHGKKPFSCLLTTLSRMNVLYAIILGRKILPLCFRSGWRPLRAIF